MFFSKYVELIQSIKLGLTTGESTATFLDYLTVIGTSFLLIGILVAIIFMVWGSVKFPGKLLKKTTGKLKEELDALYCNTTLTAVEKAKQIKAVEAKLKPRKIATITGIVVVYVPIVIPTILIVVDMLIRLL